MSSERVLVWMKPGFLGDAVMAVPLLRCLSEQYGNIDVRTGPGVQALYGDALPQLNYIESKRCSSPTLFLSYIKELKARQYDKVFLVERSFRSALASRWAAIPVRIGHATEGRSCLLTHRVDYCKEAFEAESYLDLAKADGLTWSQVHPLLPVSESDRDAMRDRVVPGAVGIQPGARHDFKQLPYASMAKVVHALHAKQIPLVLIGGKDDIRHEEQLRKHLDIDIPSLVGQCELQETKGVLTHLRLLIGSDTGLMHIAAAVGCPTVTVFGKLSSSKWGHNYDPHQVVESPKGDPSLLDPTIVIEAALHSLSVTSGLTADSR